MATDIGMTGSAYIVGRSDILSWINSTLQVEEATSGALQCQLIDIAHPSIMPMHEVNFDVKNEYQMIQNYKITELKLSVDSLEKERDFYFSKLRDIEILCQSPDIEHQPIVEAIQRIVYAAADDVLVVAEAQAMIAQQMKQPKPLSPIAEVTEEQLKIETQKRKDISTVEVDAVANTTLSPRQRLSNTSDVHCSGPPLLSC